MMIHISSRGNFDSNFKPLDSQLRMGTWRGSCNFVTLHHLSLLPPGTDQQEGLQIESTIIDGTLILSFYVSFDLFDLEL